jgi:hypothetical protein
MNVAPFNADSRIVALFKICSVTAAAVVHVAPTG